MRAKLMQAFVAFWLPFVASSSVHPPKCDDCAVQPSAVPAFYGTAYAGASDAGPK